eukprot:scaffold160723_cov45-Attheya_sp.AAC.2
MVRGVSRISVGMKAALFICALALVVEASADSGSNDIPRMPYGGASSASTLSSTKTPTRNVSGTSSVLDSVPSAGAMFQSPPNSTSHKSPSKSTEGTGTPSIPVAGASEARSPAFVRPSPSVTQLAATVLESSSQEEKADIAPVESAPEVSPELDVVMQKAVADKKGGPLKVLFLSSDTGGGHRASAESLANQFIRHYPGTTYDLLDIWTLDGCLPYRTLVPTYKHLSAHPRQWKFLYHVSNTRAYEILLDLHSRLTCERKVRRRIESYEPDVVVSVHPTMNLVPMISTRKISKKKGKNIPFFTVVTDFGSAHCTWFQRDVDKMYVASDRILKLAKRRGKTPDDKLVMSGLPIRHDFAIQAENLGVRTSKEGKAYQKSVREELGLDPHKQMVLVMGGGEGVGSLSTIVDDLYARFSTLGINATIAVVCGRNEKLRNDLETRDWEAVLATMGKRKKRERVYRMFKKLRSRRIQRALDRFEERRNLAANGEVQRGHVDVVGLGFVTRMAEYMVAADILVSKAGPGSIAEAAAVGLPVMLTSFLPGQEAGNVNVVLEGGFGDFCDEPYGIAREVACWLQDTQLLEVMSNAAMEIGAPHAASDIVIDIGTITHEHMNS